MKALGHLTKWLRNLAIKRLEATRKVYEQRTYNNMDKLLGVIQKGDVVLVEGRSDISRFIKLFTNSSWSHSALYIGDELIERDSLSKEKQPAWKSVPMQRSPIEQAEVDKLLGVIQ